MVPISLTVNGKTVSAEVEPRTLLVDFLRENLRLTGTHVGCDTSQCGTCVVLANGRSVKSCSTLAVSCDGAEITTIEGIAAADGTLHPMQQAFSEHHALQCGFCTPGMILTAIHLVEKEGGVPAAQTVRDELYGNLCRCTGYQNIVKAVISGASEMRKGGGADA